MKTPTVVHLPSLVLSSCLVFALTCIAFAHQAPHKFLQCVQSHNSESTSQVIYSKNNSSYLSNLLFSIQNIRFVSPSMPKPAFIVIPFHESQIQAAVLCSKASGLQVRIRCGGHDYEGLSYSSYVPFVIN
ncbi:UNVERIFIED_CONTAM: Tetrahydrocannabinolic acid synthase [Sesamum angustifolium]|uniref:Tetrahydrocannabinolic acid synthase n=1 Tax=Sesamum angustifolium TaxID=2727405 RepID=A0AAW2L6K7_9LAMI